MKASTAERRLALISLWDGLVPHGLTRMDLVSIYGDDMQEWHSALRRLGLREDEVSSAMEIVLVSRDIERLTS